MSSTLEYVHIGSRAATTSSVTAGQETQDRGEQSDDAGPDVGSYESGPLGPWSGQASERLRRLTYGHPRSYQIKPERETITAYHVPSPTLPSGTSFTGGG